MINCNAQFTTVPLKALSDQVWIRYQYFCLFVYFNCLFSFAVYLGKWRARFLFIGSNGETLRNTHLSSQKNDGIFQTFDQIKVSRIPLHKWPCNLRMKAEGSLEIMPPFKSIFALQLYKPCLSVRRCKRFIKVMSGVGSFHVEEWFDIIIFIMEHTLVSLLLSFL